jgi:hypothetical protein
MLTKINTTVTNLKENVEHIIYTYNLVIGDVIYKIGMSHREYYNDNLLEMTDWFFEINDESKYWNSCKSEKEALIFVLKKIENEYYNTKFWDIVCEETCPHYNNIKKTSCGATLIERIFGGTKHCNKNNQLFDGFNLHIQERIYQDPFFNLIHNIIETLTKIE